MNCPVCDNVRMREVQKNEVMIDTCPQCKGVWLDRGELDKLMKDVHEMEQDYGRMEEQLMGQQQYQQQNQQQYQQQQYQPPGNYQAEANRDGYYKDKDDYKREGHYKDDKYKHGYPYKKKKKSVFGMFEDLFD